MGTTSSGGAGATTSGTASSSHSNNNNNSSNATSNNTNATTSGRERAIETLIDREPQGDFYRAARVIEEAVPIAQASRPNLVTKAALIEQAFSLSKYEIDTLQKYDEQYLGRSAIYNSKDSTEPNTRKVDALQKERIFHYQMQVAATKVSAVQGSTSSDTVTKPKDPVVHPEKDSSTALLVTPPPTLHTKATTTTTTTTTASIITAPTTTSGSVGTIPLPSLITALRHVFEQDEQQLLDVDKEESTTSMSQINIDTKAPLERKISKTNVQPFELRQLFRSITNHPIFTNTASISVPVTSSVAAPVAADAAAMEIDTKTTPSNEQQQQQLILEKLIMNITKQIASNSSGDTEDQDKLEVSLQGLLIVVLSLLTSSQQQSNTTNTGVVDDPSQKKQLASFLAAGQKTIDREVDDLPSQLMLQVGSLLALLPLDNKAINKQSSTSTDGCAVDTSSSYTDSHRLNPELLEYFASAASIYQERWEIRKARRLARMQTPSSPSPPPSGMSSTRCHTPPPSLVFSSIKRRDDEETAGEQVNIPNDIEEEKTDSAQVEQRSRNSTSSTTVAAAETPTASGAPDMEFSLRTEDDDDDDNMNDAGDASLDAATPTNRSGMDPPATSSNDITGAESVEAYTRNEDNPQVSGDNMNDTNEDDSSDSDEEEEGDENGEEDLVNNDDDENYNDRINDIANELIENLVRNIGARVRDQEDDDGDEDDDIDEDDGASSSSGSESSEGDDDAGMGDSDDADAMDTDDDDEAVLRQAMAISVADEEPESTGVTLVAQALTSLGLGPSTTTPIESTPAADDGQQELLKGLSSTQSLSMKKHENTVIGDDEENDEASLPPFPTPPTSHNLLLTTGLNVSAPSSSLRPSEANSVSILSQLDPSNLHEFGSLPSSYVLYHLLRYATMSVDRRLAIRATSSPYPSVAIGGVGSSLFAMNRAHIDPSTSTLVDEAKADVTLQLLMTLVIVTIERRNEAIENLRKSIAKEQRIARDGSFDSERGNNESNDESPRLLSGDEEDDPALTLAMNYVEDDAVLSSESLESKGMTRKAAAAAYDTAAMMKALRRRTNCWKDEANLLSSCVACSLQLLRKYIRSLVRQQLIKKEAGAEQETKLDVKNMYKCLPESVIVSVSQGLMSLMSIGTQSSLLAIMSGDVKETERLFQSRFLYQEAVVVWGECIPLFYPTDLLRTKLLISLINECSGFANPLSNLQCLEDLSAFPNSDVETQFYKLCMLCRRLRISDLLDGFVSKPLHFVADMPQRLNSKDDLGSDSGSIDSSKPPNTAADVVVLIGNAIGSLIGNQTEIRSMYFALCNRCQSCAILFDGFYLETETEVDDRHAVTAATKTLSTGDTVRVASHPSVGLQFDATKCSDSIAVYTGLEEDSKIPSTGICSVHQRASKVWGTVLSTQHFSPKTGVHRWAVRLDKCERGHVFIGVATAQATVKTYVGGDKYGWGMIGTQALWHDRRKIRGDYGATFRSGSIIVVTLDTDAGTLSFSSWKDSSTSSLSVDPLVQSIISPRKGGPIGGVVEDWGIAFEGLPLDAKMYPAVALYQRDDRVTLLTVESPNASGTVTSPSDISGGRCYYPWMSESLLEDEIVDFGSKIRKHNNLLTWDGIRYASATLERAIYSIRNNDMKNITLTSVLPSLGAALCLLPSSVPILSGRCASFLMPIISDCILELERLIIDANNSDKSIFCHGISQGHWRIRSSNSEGTDMDYQEYEIDVQTARKENSSTYFEGKCQTEADRKTKRGLVNVYGFVNGSSITFVENWSSVIGEDVSKPEQLIDCCVVSGRLSIDGKAFEGVYRNVSSGATGHVAGRLSTTSSSSKVSVDSDAEPSLSLCAAILCVAQSHLAAILGDHSMDDLEYFRNDGVEDKNKSHEKHNALKAVLSRPLLLNSCHQTTDLVIKESILALQKYYCPPLTIDNAPSSILTNLNNFSFCEVSASDDSDRLNGLHQFISSVDNVVMLESGGRGSFCGLCPVQYCDVRQQVICTLLYYSGFDATLSDQEPSTWTPNFRDFFQMVWRNSLRILEDGVRKALSVTSTRSIRENCSDVCDNFKRTSKFLLSLKVERKSDWNLRLHEITSDLAYLFHLIESDSDLKLIEQEMTLASQRGLLRLSSLGEITRLIGLIGFENGSLIESLAVGLPRLLGRGKVDRSQVWRGVQDDDTKSEPIPYLDGNYLFRLAGSDTRITNALRALVKNVYSSLGRILGTMISQHHLVSSSRDESLMISVLAIFICQFRGEDFADFISESRLLEILPQVLANHRHSVRQNFDTDQTEEDTTVLCSTIEKIYQRDLSRAILRSSVAVIHVITFQGTMDSNASCFSCLDFLLSELDVTFSMMQNYNQLSYEETIVNSSQYDWNQYLECTDTGDHSVSTSPSVTKRISGLSYLQHQGTILTNVSFNSHNKSWSSLKTASLGNWRQSTDHIGNLCDGFSHQFMSHWLHILCAVLRTHTSINYILDQKIRLPVLLNRIGLQVKVSVDGTVQISQNMSHLNSANFIHGRFRARLLRLLLPLFSAMTASEELVRGMFIIIGSSSACVTQSHDADEWLVCREAISLLRHLYSLPDQLWKSCIEGVFTTISDKLWAVNEEVTPFFKIGILEFFSGGHGALCRGSYVLIKPSAATMLSPDSNSLASIKSHSGGSGGSSSPTSNLASAPHHLMGNGTSSVITGLFSSEVSAGIVSNIDLKNASCEVILVGRGLHETRDKNSHSDHRHTRSIASTKSNTTGRQTLTIRAVRTSLTDVVQANEVPLVLDGSVSFDSLLGEVFSTSLDRLLHTNCYDSDKVNSFSSDLLVLRSCIVVLSDKEICSSFLSQSYCKTILSKVLDLAWPTASDDEAKLRLLQNKCLSQLGSHDARLAHLVRLLRDLKFRRMAMTKTSEQQQAEWFEYTRKRNVFESSNLEATKMGSSDTKETAQPLVTSSKSGDSVAVSRDNGAVIGSSTSRTSSASSADEDEETSEAAATAAAHLREAAIAQMAELGLPRSWSEYALRRIGVINIEAAVTFCLERGPDIERLIADEQERDRLTREFSTGSNRRRGNRDVGPSSRLLRQLLEMGFPKRWCAEALAVTGNNVDEALTWILNNSERLSEDDEAIEAGGENEEVNENETESIDDQEEEDDEDDIESDETPIDTKSPIAAESGQLHPESSPCWSGSITPVSFISGRAIIDPVRMEISGLPSGGFSSVGTKGILLTTGKWYYEAVLETAGCLQIGWADGSFAGHCHAERGDGCGDGPSSWAFDGWRRYRWHATATEWGCRWKEGDVVGCMVDMDNHVISFTLNGEGESIGMGVAFTGEGFRPCGGVYACVSFNKKEKLRLLLGGSGNEPFKYQPPDGYRGVGEAVLEAVRERDILLSKEFIIDSNIPKNGNNESVNEIKRFICDYSDTDHGHELTAWAHRYYGSDASVHLGSVKSKQSTTKHVSNSTATEQLYSPFLTRRLFGEWGQKRYPKKKDSIDISSVEKITENIIQGYDEIEKKLDVELFCEHESIGLLLARKLLLHLVITAGKSFNLHFFTKDDDNQRERALRFWNVVEVCTSLRPAGWIGEAGAMAIAAEALGLCISSNDQLQSRSNGDRRGVISANDLDENLQLPVCGYSQLLTFVLTPKSDIYARHFVSASAEAAMCGDGGSGILTFLQEGLQSAACKSKGFRHVLVATIRRGVRQLAVVEYENDDSEAPGKKMDDNEDETEEAVGDAAKNRNDSNDDSSPDARLISFLSGLLLSEPMQSVDDFEAIQIELFEAWTVGLLSASLPWRMICAFTAAGILNKNVGVFQASLKERPTLARYFGRLKSTVARRLWAERAAVPICSRYAQSLVELVTSVNRSVKISSDLPNEFLQLWDRIDVDAATPLPQFYSPNSSGENWESDEGWVCSDSGFEVWTGFVEIKPSSWKIPSRSNVRTLMDGGDGPPLVTKGCTVMRGINWDQEGNDYGNDDGKDIFEAEKALREKEKNILDDQVQVHDGMAHSAHTNSESDSNKNTAEITVSPDPADESESAGISNDCTTPTRTIPQSTTTGSSSAENEVLSRQFDETQDKKSKKIPSPRLPVGTVLSIESWLGIPGMARRVKWHLTGKEGIYRYGGDGGMYDLCHVEINSKETKIKKRHPLPESSEQCAARHGFGAKATHNILLRIKRSGKEIALKDCVCYEHDGILEWPDFGAGVRVKCFRQNDGTVIIEEQQLLFGSKDSGWISRFGEPSYNAGSRFVLTPKLEANNIAYKDYEELSGLNEFNVKVLRNPADGKPLKVISEMRLFRGFPSFAVDPYKLPRSLAPLPPPLTFDSIYHSSSLSLSRDCRTVSCTSSDSGRGTVFGSLGFTKGVHYWEVKLEQADIGSVFIGVAEKSIGSGSGSSYVYDTPPRLNRWLGWGFVNFRATYTAGAERVFGSHCHAGDTVGVMLDCDAGRLSFFFDGLKYGEHILNDLGCAFENLSPFGFNVDGCGSGGSGQGAPSGFENGSSNRFPAQGTIRPRTLWPVVGLRNHGDRVTISPKWCTSFGTDGVVSLKNIVKVDEILASYKDHVDSRSVAQELPRWFVKESFLEYNRWHENGWTRSSTRGSGPYRDSGICLDVDFDSSPLACAAASASLGLKEALLAGDRVKLTRSAGRVLQLAEEALVVGVYNGRLYYRIVSQKSEGGSLTEGGGRAWCWDESEVVDGLPFVTQSKGRGILLPKLSRFSCQSSGLKVVYESGAVLRSDLEIFDGSETLGTIPFGTIIPKNAVIDRRINSCGGLRFRVRYEPIGEGWISERIRGGTEELIVESIEDKLNDSIAFDEEKSFDDPMKCANTWYAAWKDASSEDENPLIASLAISSEVQFSELISHGVMPGLSIVDSDCVLISVMNTVSNFSINGDATESLFEEVVAAVSYAYTTVTGNRNEYPNIANTAANQAVAEIFSKYVNFPPLNSLLARMAILRYLNRRVRLALPWLSTRPCQEGSAMFGGMYGYGTSPDRSGRCYDSGQSKWFQAPSIATKIRSLRRIIFTSVKRDFLSSVVDATTTATLLSHDEYELPREIRTVRINRLKAARAMLSDDVSAKRKYSVFSQLHNETKTWGGASLRRGFVAKGHGGQKRAFKVKLIGEGVNDYSGPYREAFTDAMADIVRIEPNGRCSLGVLDPTPNNATSIGENRDLFMFSLNNRNLPSSNSTSEVYEPTELRIRRNFASLMVACDESSREVEESLVFLGRLVGTAFRHGIPLDIPLPFLSVWKALVEDPVGSSQKLLELDYLAHSQLENENDADSSPLLLWQQRMLNAFSEGLGNVLPMEILPLLTGEELREMMCGNPDVDVELLKQVVEYEGYNPTDDVITYFWSTLNEMTSDERKQFLQFVWARNRLPMRESDFDAPFKIQKDVSKGGQALPSASTCFFTLTLPEYADQQTLREKLLFAIRNVTTMETDFQTNSAEIAEGYRSF